MSAAPSKTIRPCVRPSTGAMKPSPAGRLPKLPGALRSPSSAIPERPSIERTTSVPPSLVTRTSDPEVRASATACARRATSAASARIVRASISTLTRGMLATRAPCSQAARRAAVCDSDFEVGAATTALATIAAAT
jgi:hypothetical protein